jgi:hypothetical protein
MDLPVILLRKRTLAEADRQLECSLRRKPAIRHSRVGDLATRL